MNPGEHHSALGSESKENLHPSPAELRHELRTPLNQIIGYSEMLIEDAHEEDQAQLIGEIESIHALAYDLVRLIQETLPSSLPASETATDRAREVLSKSISDLHEAACSLAERPETLLSEFAAHIKSAAQELQQFSSGGRVPSSQTPAARTVESVAQSARANLLVADDSERNREVLRHQLERQGYSVTSVADGSQALRLLQERPFDLVLLDILMPELDGFTTLEKIKADSRLREIPVIMISASDEYSSVIRCIESGAEDYLPKPFDPVLLRARLKASLEKKSLRDEQKRRTEELESAYRHLQQIQDQLVTQQKLASLGSLAAGIAHEIKNPLNFVTNFAALSSDLIRELQAMRLAQDDGEVAEILRDLASNNLKIKEHGDRADRIVRGMLRHARTQPGERQLTDVNSLVRDCIGLAYHGLRSQDNGFNATIETSLCEELPKINVFPQDLSRVFLNITTNAFYAVSEKQRKSGADYQPKVTITTSADAHDVEVRIRDNGDGISPALRNKIFEPFYTTKPAGVGTGLGLSISHDVVFKEHRGELLVDSVEGEYTEFVTRLPREVPE